MTTTPSQGEAFPTFLGQTRQTLGQEVIEPAGVDRIHQLSIGFSAGDAPPVDDGHP